LFLFQGTGIETKLIIPFYEILSGLFPPGKYFVAYESYKDYTFSKPEIISNILLSSINVYSFYNFIMLNNGNSTKYLIRGWAGVALSATFIYIHIPLHNQYMKKIKEDIRKIDIELAKYK
jgi:hypothetical protein